MVLGIFMKIISLLSSLPAFVVYALLFFAFTGIADIFWLFIISIIVCTVIIWLLRLIFKGKRENTKSIEQQLLKHGTKGKGLLKKFKDTYLKLEERSFASGHVARVGAFGYIYYEYNSSIEALIIFVCVALVVAISRIYLKKHNRLDVFIGFVIGLIAGYVAKIILIHL